jgi:OmpA-OmpF porin, OOP family
LLAQFQKREDKIMRNSKRIVACTALLFVLCAGFAYGESNGKKVKVSGLITGRDGEDLTLKNTKDQSSVVVVLTDSTKVQTPKGLGLRKAQQSVTALIPGLKIQVDGMGDDSHVVAKTITFSNNDLLLAETIQAGLSPTRAQQAVNQANIAANAQGVAANKEGVAANSVQTAANKQQIDANQEQIGANQQDIAATTQRFSELSEYDTKGTATLLFDTGSAKLSAQDRTSLTQLAQSAISLKGYIIQVKGFADSTGTAAMNEQLSMDRAQAVVAYLLQNCNVPLRHIVAPGAMGISDPSAPNETAAGRAENRRVEVKVLVNRGVAGGA